MHQTVHPQHPVLPRLSERRVAHSYRLQVFLVLTVSCLLNLPAIAQDTFSVVNPETGVRSQFQGQVIAWDRERVTYVTGGRERQIATRRVVHISYPKSPGQQEADRFFDVGRFDQAALSFDNAIKSESRQWVVEEMRARRMQCDLATGQINSALFHFLEIIRGNPQTRFFHLIPLAWQNHERVEGALAAELEKLLARDDPLRGLIAASWLLMTKNQTATARLNQLAIASDSRIAQLATAQLWRSQVITADTAELRRWRLAIDRMPEPLQAGPRFLVGMVQQRFPGDDHTVIAFMQIPVLFPDQYQLAGSALLQASQLLGKLGRDDEARLVARELLQSYAYSYAANRLQNPVDQIDQ